MEGDGGRGLADHRFSIDDDAHHDVLLGKRTPNLGDHLPLAFVLHPRASLHPRLLLIVPLDPSILFPAAGLLVPSCSLGHGGEANEKWFFRARVIE